MRILILSSEFAPQTGGIGTYACEMALAASAMGHEVTVVAADYGEDRTAQDAACPFELIRYNGGPHRMRDLPAKVALVRRLARQRPGYDIVHAADWPFFLPLALSRFRGRARCILTFHGTEAAFMQHPKRAVVLRLVRFWNGWADAVANSRYTAERLRQGFAQSEADVRVVRPGVSEGWLYARVERDKARAALGIAQTRFVIISLGRVVQRKGHLALAAAIALLPDHVQANIQWQIIGPLPDPGLEANLRMAAASLHCETLITGRLDDRDVAQRLSASDLFCLPGHVARDGAVEGFGLVYLEAAAMGVPSLATNAGGVEDAVDHGESGILVPPNDTDVLAAEILRLYRDPDALKRLADGALRRARGSRWESVAAETYRPARQKMVFMINSLAGGGAERIMARLIAHSEEWAQRYDIHLVLLDEEPSAYDLPDWVTVHRLDTRWSVPRGLARGVALLRRLGPVACLSFLTRSNVINVVASRLSGCRPVISERVNASSHHPKTPAGNMVRLLTRLVYPRAERVICPSAGVAADLVAHFGVAQEKAMVIANPVDSNMVWRMSEEDVPTRTTRPYLVAVGRLVANKNFAMLLDAFALSSVDFDLVILGEGPLRAMLEEQARGLGLEGRVHFAGFAENPFPVIRGAHAFVLPSNAEGFPNSLVEAMALGVPVISTNCRSGPSEILDDKTHLDIDRLYHARYGLLVPVDDAAAMADALRAMAEPETCAAYAIKAGEGAARYRLESTVEAYWSVLEGEIGPPAEAEGPCFTVMPSGAAR